MAEVTVQVTVYQVKVYFKLMFTNYLFNILYLIYLILGGGEL